MNAISATKYVFFPSFSFYKKIIMAFGIVLLIGLYPVRRTINIYVKNHKKIIFRIRHSIRVIITYWLYLLKLANKYSNISFFYKWMYGIPYFPPPLSIKVSLVTQWRYRPFRSSRLSYLCEDYLSLFSPTLSIVFFLFPSFFSIFLLFFSLSVYLISFVTLSLSTFLSLSFSLYHSLSVFFSLCLSVSMSLPVSASLILCISASLSVSHRYKPGFNFWRAPI